MPCWKFTCKTCKKKVSKKADDRTSAIRRHYKAKHPSKFKKMIKKAVKTRKEKKKK